MMLDGAFSESDFNKIYAETYNGIVFEKNKNFGSVINKICGALGVSYGDIIEYVPQNEDK